MVCSVCGMVLDHRWQLPLCPSCEKKRAARPVLDPPPGFGSDKINRALKEAVEQTVPLYCQRCGDVVEAEIIGECIIPAPEPVLRCKDCGLEFIVEVAGDGGTG